MKTTRTILLALGGLLLVTPCAHGDSRRGGSRSGGSTVTITYTYRTYGS